jgi:hypothetical protein
MVTACGHSAQVAVFWSSQAKVKSLTGQWPSMTFLNCQWPEHHWQPQPGPLKNPKGQIL